jgi:Zn-dependent protease
MLTGSISLGRLAGASLRLHWSAILVATILAVGLATSESGLSVPAAVVGVVAFFASILGHELAHALVARRFGVATTSIDLWALGGVARLEHEPKTAKAEGWIAAAGPLASIAIGVIAYGTAYGAFRLDAPDTVVTVLGWLGIVNAALGVFNLLPGAPLDGGRIVRAIRWARHGNRHRAMREAGQAGRVIGWAIAAVGLGLMLNDRPGLWLLVTGVFIALNAKAEIAFAHVSERLGGITVGELTWFGVAETGTDMDADSMIWQRSRLGGAGAVAVRGDDGELDGLVLEDQLWAVPVEQRPWVMLTSLMAPFSRLAKADPDDELASVLPRLNPLRPVVTVWRDNRLLGVVPPNALRQKLQVLRPGGAGNGF